MLHERYLGRRRLESTYQPGVPAVSLSCNGHWRTTFVHEALVDPHCVGVRTCLVMLMSSSDLFSQLIPPWQASW